MTAEPPLHADGAWLRQPRHADGRRTTVELWAACFGDAEAIPGAWTAVLDSDERTRVGRLRQPRMTLGYAGRHAMLREVIGAALGRPPARLRFSAGPFGKPTLADVRDRTLQFNLSTSGEVAILAIRYGAAVGVDIETIRPLEKALGALFTPAEQVFVAQSDEPRRSQTLLRLWVCKEAALKVAGHGLSHPLDAIQVETTSDVGVLAATVSGGAPTRFAIQPFGLTATIIGAVATDKPVGLSLRWWRRCQRRAACSACTTSLMA